MFRQLFHKDVFFPNGVEKVVEALQHSFKKYQLSNHFQEHLNNQAGEDRSHTYLKNAVINNLNELGKERIFKPFEIELSKSFRELGTSDWIVTKYCIRVAYSHTQDLVIVIRPGWDKEKLQYNPEVNLIVTAWINHKQDAHFTLDESKYCSKDKWNSIV